MKRSTARILLLCLIFFIWLTDCAGQSSKPKKYTTIITTLGTARTKGILLEANDSSVLIYSRGREMRIPVSTIDKIKIKRFASAGSGALIGSSIGLVAGATIGFASGDEDPSQSFYSDPVTAEEKALILGIVLSVGGALIGTIIGAASHVEVVMTNGDQNIFLNNADKIRQYATQQRQED